MKEEHYLSLKGSVTHLIVARIYKKKGSNVDHETPKVSQF